MNVGTLHILFTLAIEENHLEDAATILVKLHKHHMENGYDYPEQKRELLMMTQLLLDLKKGVLQYV